MNVLLVACTCIESLGECLVVPPPCQWELVVEYVMGCEIWYHQYDLKNVEIIDGGVLLLG